MLKNTNVIYMILELKTINYFLALLKFFVFAKYSELLLELLTKVVIHSNCP